MKRSHFREQAQIIVARETVRAQTNVESESLQPWELEIAVPKVGVAARTMRDWKFLSNFRQQIEIAFRQFIQMRNDPRRRFLE
jgi:hypothetical protein